MQRRILYTPIYSPLSVKVSKIFGSAAIYSTRSMSDAANATKAQEAALRRNPHGDFSKVQQSRPDWKDESWRYTKTADPSWSFGQGASDKSGQDKKHIEIDPHEEGRNPGLNYKLLISGIVPRPIGFISTQSKDGKTTNLAPMSYTQMVHHDPPMFVVGFSSSKEKAKDTLRNIIEIEECVINMISEHFVEAANATSINAPYGTSEWLLSGLTPKPSKLVAPARVGESIFSVECKLREVKEFDSKAKPGTVTGSMVILEGVNFWVREDAINEERSLIDPAVLKPVSRLGGITYGRVLEGFELLRPDFENSIKDPETKRLLGPKV
jgi:flavin reductase (DIM6/NTAB) family NADH-FMN oxidoreductase RutF